MEFHDVANIFPMMSSAEYGALTNDILENGQHEPIWTHDGKIIDGRNRYQACLELGIEPRFREWNGQGSLVAFVVSLNLHRRHLDESQRAMVGARIKPMFENEARARQGARTDLRANLRGGDSGKASQKAAEAVNVSPRSVESASRVIERGVPGLADAVLSGNASVSAATEVATLSPEEQEEVLAAGPDAIREAAKEVRAAKQEGRAPHVSNNSGNNEWYTPPEYLEAAHAVMGGIDTDPASCDLANKHVKAAEYFSVDDDGLSQEWTGRAWMNPPYSGDLIGRFIDRMVDQYRRGNVTEAIVLVNNATETAWFQTLAAQADAICFPKGRIKYLDSTGKPANTPLQGQAFIYLGPQKKAFHRVFSAFGFVVNV